MAERDRNAITSNASANRRKHTGSARAFRLRMRAEGLRPVRIWILPRSAPRRLPPSPATTPPAPSFSASSMRLMNGRRHNKARQFPSRS